MQDFILGGITVDNRMAAGGRTMQRRRACAGLLFVATRE